jgi:hypothetical protein
MCEFWAARDFSGAGLSCLAADEDLHLPDEPAPDRDRLDVAVCLLS